MASRRSLDVPSCEANQSGHATACGRAPVRARSPWRAPWSHWVCLSPVRGARAMPEKLSRQGTHEFQCGRRDPTPKVVGTRRGFPAGPSSMHGIGFDGRNVRVSGHARRLGPNTSRNACWINFAFDETGCTRLISRCKMEGARYQDAGMGRCLRSTAGCRDAVRAQPGFPGSPAKAPHRKRKPPFPAARFAHLGYRSVPSHIAEPGRAGGGAAAAAHPGAWRSSVFSSPRSSLDSTRSRPVMVVRDTNCSRRCSLNASNS